jgi:hypothetical protein
MIRNVLLSCLLVAFAAVVVGCSKSDASRKDDAPVQGKQGVNKKGQTQKTMEADFNIEPGK